MANTENIEAKLCAYIDGELDEQGRAEIEKHLAANPQHRGLIEELSKQRLMLRALPRESAPDEIMETLQGQLERAGLLGDDRAAEVDAAAMRINRWPQVMAAAAIVLLAVGLVGIIYFVLPGQGGGNDAYVIGEVPSGDDAAAKLRMSTTGEAADSDPPAPGGGEAFARRDVSEKREEVAMKTAETPAAALPAAPADPLDATPAATGQATPAPTEMAYAPKKDDPFEARPGKAGEADAVATSIGTELKQAQERLFSADLTRQLQNKPGGIQQNSMVVFVCASDANAANGEVTNYLASNGIQYEDVAEGPPAPLDEAVTRDMHLSKNAPTRVQSKSMTFRQATQSPDVNIEQTVTLPPPPEATAGAGQQQNVTAAQAEQIAATPPATQQSDVTGGAFVQQRQGGDERFAMTANNDARRQRMIIARNMTQQQAADLSNSLLKQSYVQRASVYPTALRTGNAASGGVATGSGSVATTVPMTLAANDAPPPPAAANADLDALDRSRTNAAPTTQESALSATGTVGDKAKEQPTTVPLLAEAPATRPAQDLSSSAAGAAASEMERADRGAAPTTAPAGDFNLGAAAQVFNEPATTQQMPLVDAQQRVDVVIVLQDDEAIDPALGRALDPSAGPMPAPETQPVAPPAEPPVAPQQQTEQLPAAEPPVVDSPAPTQQQQQSPQP